MDMTLHREYNHCRTYNLQLRGHESEARYCSKWLNLAKFGRSANFQRFFVTSCVDSTHKLKSRYGILVQLLRRVTF